MSSVKLKLKLDWVQSNLHNPSWGNAGYIFFSSLIVVVASKLFATSMLHAFCADTKKMIVFLQTRECISEFQYKMDSILSPVTVLLFEFPSKSVAVTAFLFEWRYFQIGDGIFAWRQFRSQSTVTAKVFEGRTCSHSRSFNNCVMIFYKRDNIFLAFKFTIQITLHTMNKKYCQWGPKW